MTSSGRHRSPSRRGLGLLLACILLFATGATAAPSPVEEAGLPVSNLFEANTKGTCTPTGCSSTNCLDRCARILIDVLDGRAYDLCPITNGVCTCQAGYGQPGSAVFSDPSENKGPVCHAALYAGRNVASDRQWWNEYFNYQTLGPNSGAGFMGKEIFSPLYGSFIVASVMTALDTAEARGHNDVANKARQWLRAYWALASLASRPGGIQNADVVYRHGTQSISGTYNNIRGASQVTAGPRMINNLGSATYSTLHPLLSMALNVGPKAYTPSMNTSFAFYGGVRAAARIAGFSFTSSYSISNFGSFTAPASKFGLTNAERNNLAMIVRGQSGANFQAAISMVGNYKPKCNMSFLRTTQGSISWFGTSESGAAGEQRVCNAAKGQLFAARLDSNGKAYHLQPALETQLPNAAKWKSFRLGNQICADVDPTWAAQQGDTSYTTGPWCIGIPGGTVLQELSWTRNNGLRFVGSGGQNDPILRVQADFVGPINHNGSLDFGSAAQASGQYVELVIRLMNDGPEAMVASASTTNTVGSAFVQVEQPSSPVPPESNTSVFRLRMRRDTVGNFQGTVRITHDATNVPSPFTFTVNGQVTGAPQTLTLTPNADAWVIQNNPTLNYGSSSQLHVRNGDTGQARRSFLRFQVPSYVTNVQSAGLYMFVGGYITEAGFYRLNNMTWSEFGINWNNHLDPPTTYTYMRSLNNAGYGYHAIDVSEAVTGPGTVNIGIASGSDTSGQYFISREGNYDPVLVITYQP
ncbi:MAG: DNRLRE domain-containing protein [Acidobacteriota bacterium]|nr:DNRLRE domain-containing protein [Acidobacteriota bacterium]